MYKKEKGVTYEYKGTTFVLTENTHYKAKSTYTVTSIKTHGRVIEFPSSYHGYVVDQIEMDDVYNAPKPEDEVKGAEELVVPREITRISLGNWMFPNLRALWISPDNEEYSTDGASLFNKKGNILLRALAAGRQTGRVIVPASVQKIADYGFAYTTCDEIIFENRSISVQTHSFHHSAWISSQPDVVYIGNMLYVLKNKTYMLEVQEGTQRFHEDAFHSYSPAEMITSVLPSANLMKYDRRRYYSESHLPCRKLTFTGSAGTINWNRLRDWNSLERIDLPNHKKYKTLDGVVFSKNGKTILFYPPCRKDTSYRIPDGVESIGALCFFEARYLERVYVPDSVRTVRQGAFYHCQNLKEVYLSDNITEIGDSTAFQPYGLFQYCSALEEIHLPNRLTYLGSYALYGTGLTELSLPDKLQHIGAFALSETDISSITLPKTLRSIGTGALENIQDVTATEGTAHGLISALEVKINGEFRWNAVRIRMFSNSGKYKDTIVIPESLKHMAGAMMEAAWNEASFDYSEYDACFEHIQNTEEKIAFATRMVGSGRELRDSPYESYLRRMSSRILENIVNECSENAVVEFVRQGYLSKSSLQKALKLCNASGMNTAAAYLVRLLKKDGKSRKTAAIRI